QVDDPQVGIGPAKRLQARARIVLAPVVDEDDLVADAESSRDAAKLFVEPADVFSLVVDRNDERQLERWPPVHLAKKLTTASTTRSTAASVRSGCIGSESISRAACSARGSEGVSPNVRSQAGWRWIGTGEWMPVSISRAARDTRVVFRRGVRTTYWWETWG